MQRIFDFLRISDIPQLARRNYLAELGQTSLWGIVAGALEGPIAAVVAAKTFNASGLLTAIVFSIPISANLFNLLWSVAIRGQRRVRTFVLLACGTCVGVFSIGLTDAAWGAWGARVFAAQMLLTHLFTSGLITLRTTLWRANYPQSHRARIAGRLQTLRMLLSLLTAAALSALFDWHAEYYRFVYPLVAVLGLLSLWPMRRMRVRGEKTELQRLREHLANNSSSGKGTGLWEGLKESAAILRDDRAFAQYMFAQFLLGSANFISDPVLVFILTTRLGLSYFSSTFLMFQLPIAVLLISIRSWARYFDHVGVLRFRIANSACWVVSYACVLVAVAVISLSGETVIWPALAILFVGRILRGPWPRRRGYRVAVGTPALRPRTPDRALHGYSRCAYRAARSSHAAAGLGGVPLARLGYVWDRFRARRSLAGALPSAGRRRPSTGPRMRSRPRRRR